MNLEFKIDGLDLQIEVFEREERLPSFKTKLQINFSHPTGKFNYSANDIWFECYVWDVFIAKMALLNDHEEIVLNSMSEEFIFELSINKVDILLKEVSFNGLAIELKYSQELTRDDLFFIKESFANFNRWW